MSEKCFNSYVKTFEDSLGNKSELVIKEALNTNLNDTIYGMLQCLNFNQKVVKKTSKKN